MTVVSVAWLLLAWVVIGLAARTLIADLREGREGRSWSDDCEEVR